MGYLLDKAQRDLLQKEAQAWAEYSLANAMRGLEDEAGPAYSPADLKISFS